MTRRHPLRRALRTTQAGIIGMLVALILGPGAVLPATAESWRPPPATTWQWQLQGTIDLDVQADVFDIDMDQSANVVAALHSRGKKVICYVNVGAWERFRSDAGSFPESVLGSVYSGYPDERWLDIRQISILAPLMRARFDNCRQKGFDAVEPDNMDGYGQSTGFPLSSVDQINYNRWIATEVHARGMSVGLKNDTDQASELQPNFDFAVSEQCFEFRECGIWRPFLNAGKAVFEAEYSLSADQFCPAALSMGISAIQKHLSLDGWRVSCGTSTPPPVCDGAWPNPGAAQGRLVAWAPGRLDIFELATSGGLWHDAYSSGHWAGPELQGAPPGGIASDPVAVSWERNRLDVFAIGGDGNLYHKWSGGMTWSAWELQGNPGSALTGQPAAVAWSANRLDVIVRTGAGSLWHKWWDGSSWSGWEAHGNPGVAGGDPSLVSWASGRLDLFVVGSDGKLYHQWYPGGWSSSWEGPSGPAANLSVGAPAVVAWAANRLDIAAVDVQTCALWVRSWNGASWSGWVPQGAPPGSGLISDASLVAWSPNRLDLFVLGTGGNLWHKYYLGGGWSGWEAQGKPGAALTGRPAVVSWAPNRLDVVVRDGTGHVWHNWWNNTPPWGFWEDHGTV